MVAWFLRSGSLILLTVGIAKLLGSFGNDGILDQDDPVFKVSLRFLTRWVGSLEILVSIICFLSRKHGFSAALIAIMATDFAIYRVGMMLTGSHRTCPCLGSITGFLHIPNVLADRIATMLFLYLIVGSYVAVFWLWRTGVLFGTDRTVSATLSKVVSNE